jgi:hypothetical protein
MGPNETTSMIPGGPRVISVFDGSGCHRAQIKHFLGMQIGSRFPHGLGLKLISRLHRTRWSSGLPESSEDDSWPSLTGARWLAKDLAHMYLVPEAPAHAV